MYASKMKTGEHANGSHPIFSQSSRRGDSPPPSHTILRVQIDTIFEWVQSFLHLLQMH